MHLKSGRFTLGTAFFLLTVGFGCDGSSPADVDSDGGRTMGNDGGTGGSGGGKLDGGTSMMGDASTRDVTVRPPPEVNAQAKRLVPGLARLLGSGLNSCSNQVPAVGDRWCVF